MTKKEIKTVTRDRIKALKSESKRDQKVLRAEEQIKEICEKYELDTDRFVQCDYTSNELMEILVTMKNSDRKKLSAAWKEFFNITNEDMPAALVGAQA